ncbi:MAG: prephenate dehydrogenase/arogenate dehydrogenase family protein [Ottowia sp.]|nr:prephenate dehydrogenase/arogenate dehydrogenase family protein [Ottowia sp.]
MQALNKIGTLVVVGVGLIGGSLALALKRAGAVARVLGVDRSPQACAQGLLLGVIDAAMTLEDAVAQADVIVLCVPVAQTAEVLRGCVSYLPEHTIVTDVGSTKCDVVAVARDILGSKLTQFVPGHPIAGLERNGVTCAVADLFVRKQVVLCPLPENAATDVAIVESMWQTVGGRCRQLSAEQHDEVFATVSHLPHLLSYALVTQIMNADDAQIKWDFAGGGFRDFTRIACSSAEMWRDVCLTNRVALLEELSTYQTILAQVKTMIELHQGEELLALFRRAATTRLAWGERRNEEKL